MSRRNNPLQYTTSRRACTCNAARGDSDSHMRRRAPYNSGFARKTRAKLLEFQVGLYSNNNPLFCNAFLCYYFIRTQRSGTPLYQITALKERIPDDSKKSLRRRTSERLCFYKNIAPFVLFVNILYFCIPKTNRYQQIKKP